MDAKNGLEAFTAIRNLVDEGAEREAFDTAVAEQYNHAAETAGPVAVANQVQTPETPFEAKSKTFLDPEATMSVTEQLDTMNEFWGELNWSMPVLSEENEQHLQTVLEANPGKRVVPTPLVDPYERVAIAEDAKAAFPKNEFTANGKALWTPDESWTYGKLLRSPESVVQEDRKKYALGYKTPDGVVTTRSDYIESLIEAGQAVKQGELVWTFPVTDVSVQSERTYTTASKLHEATDPVETPESLIVTQLLHQANGTPNPNWAVDFANEAVYEVKEAGKGSDKHIEFGAVVSVASVNWNPNYRRVLSVSWNPQDRGGGFGRRDAASGISKA